MQPVGCRLRQIANAGYQVKATFTVSEFAWKNYYEPLLQRLVELGATKSASQALLDIQKEINRYEKYLGEFGCQFSIVQRTLELSRNPATEFRFKLSALLG